MTTITSDAPVEDDIQDLMENLLDQIHLMNVLCDQVSMQLEPRHHQRSQKKKTRAGTSKRKKLRIFSSSEDDSSSSSQEDSLPSEDNHTLIDHDSDDDDEQKALKARHGPRTRNEISLDDLPPIENLTITLSDETPIEPIGYVRHIIDGKLVIIEALLHSPPLNDDSVLFNSDRRSIGLIFETFGLVEKPYYSIRYHNAENLNQRHIELNQQVFYAPKETTYTKYVFVQELRALKGSDASWEDDNEPPKSAIDYSDDEQERTARAILKSKRTTEDGVDESMMDSPNTDPTNVPPPYGRTDRGRGRGRQRGFRRDADSGRPPPSLPNWFQNTSSATSSFPSRPTFSQQQQPPPSWRQSSHPTASTQFPFSSVPHSGNTNPRLQSTQQALQGNNSTHSVFPWM